MTNETVDINQLLGGVGKASSGGLLEEGQHVVQIINIVPGYRKAESKDGVKKGWSDSTPEIVVTLGNSDGVTTQWLNPVAYKRLEDVTMTDILALASDTATMKKLGLKMSDLLIPGSDPKKKLYRDIAEIRPLFIEEVVIDAKYNADEHYAVRRDNNCRIIDPVRSEKGRQIMDRLAVHSGICAEGESYGSILSAKGREIGIEIEESASGGTKVKRTMKAEDVE